MLAHHLQPWLNNKTALAKHLIFKHDIERFCPQQNQVSAYFTSVQILSIEHAVTNKKEAVTSA